MRGNRKENTVSDRVLITYLINTWKMICEKYEADMVYLIDGDNLSIQTFCLRGEGHSRLQLKNGVLVLEYLELPEVLRNRGFLTAFLDSLESKKNRIREVKVLSVRDKFIVNFLERRGYKSYTLPYFPKKCFRKTINK